MVGRTSGAAYLFVPVRHFLFFKLLEFKLSSTYATSGVNLDRASAAKKLIAQAAKSTHTSNVVRGIGLFGGFYALDEAVDGQVLVASTDGVGTKVLLAAQLGKYFRTGRGLGSSLYQ